jgi:hypothetical protein
MRPFLRAIMAAIVAAASAGCETFTPATCDLTEGAGDNPLVMYAGGTTTSTPEGTYNYTSLHYTSPDEPQLLYLPGGMYYGLETGLPCTPSVQMSLSFEVDGGAVAQAAGNEVLLLGLDAPDGGDGGADDGYTIRVASNSCAAFWLLVTATATCPPP